MQSIQDLRAKQDLLKKELKKIEKAIEAFRDVCNHKYESDGHTDGGGKRYKKCQICGNPDWD